MRIVFLFGPAAVGKYTVGRALSQLTGLPLFHNHLTVDLVRSLFDFGSEGFVALRENVWLQSFREATKRGRSLIFTFHPEASVAAGFPEAVRDLVEAEGGRVDFVELSCEEQEIEARVENPSRAEFGKLNSLSQYRELLDSGAFDHPPMPEPRLRVPTDNLSPDDAARLIAGRLDLSLDSH